MDKPVSVMIADSSESFRKALGELVDSQEDMFMAAEAGDGLEAARLAEELKPEVLITELLLRELEGLALMNRLRERNAMPYTIVVTSFFNDALAERASELGAARFFPKPCRESALIEAIRSRESTRPEAENRQSRRMLFEREHMIEEALICCGVDPCLRGRGYLMAALCAAWDEPELLEGATKRLYPELAERFGTSSVNFERCIRSAIAGAWRDGDAQRRMEFFGGDKTAYLEKKPGNIRFMKLVLERLRKREY